MTAREQAPVRKPLRIVMKTKDGVLVSERQSTMTWALNEVDWEVLDWRFRSLGVKMVSYTHDEKASALNITVVWL